jgi:hypothetical protein
MWASLWSGPDVPNGQSSPSPAIKESSAAHRIDKRDQTNGVVPSSGEVCSSNIDTINSKTAANTISRILRGVVVGEAMSGKTCLIRRLRGEDPFQQKIENNDRFFSRNKNLMALIPWKVSDMVSALCQKLYPVQGDEVVQLYVSEGKSFCYTTRKDNAAFQKQWTSVLQSQRGKDLDFIIWIIDPRMKNILDFVRDGLDTLYAARNNCKGDKASDDIKQQPPIQQVCILLNFRDCIETDNNDQTLLVGQIQNIIKQVIESYKEDRDRQNHVKRFQLQSHLSETDRTPTILVYESSMSDCYGLDNLLSFISLPYLSHKEQEFRRLAEQLQTQHVQWKDEMLKNRGIVYEDFIKQRKLVQQNKSSSGEHKSPSRRIIHHQMTSSPGEMNLLSRPRRSPGSNSDKSQQQETSTSAKNQHKVADNVSSSAILSLPALNDTVTRTLFARPNQLFAGSNGVSNSGVPVDDSLDLFFSDDDEEEEADEQSETDENDCSDDEDFFIDIDRKRRVRVDIAAVRTRTKKLSSNGIHTTTPIVTEDHKRANDVVSCAKLSDENVAEGLENQQYNEETLIESHDGNANGKEYAADDNSDQISESKSKVVESIDRSNKEKPDTNKKSVSLVLDSDNEESIAGDDIQQCTRGEVVIEKNPVPSTSSMIKHIITSTPDTKKTVIPMSNAARAAIDAARKEAEAMMNVQSQQTIPDEIMREKKIKKRNKDEKKEKKKKKDRGKISRGY